MSVLFFGKYNNAVHKMRIVIPFQFKEIIPNESPDPDNPIRRVMVTIGARGEILVYPLKAWEELYKRHAESDNDFLEYHLNFVYGQTLEGPGRIRISEELMEITGITDKVEAVIRGEGSHMSIWHPNTYNNYTSTVKTIDSKEYKPRDFRIVSESPKE